MITSTLDSKRWTDEELLFIRLKNMAKWDAEDLIFYEDINRELFDILQKSNLPASSKDNQDSYQQ